MLNDDIYNIEEQQEINAKKQQKEFAILNEKFAICFNTPCGKEVLQHLENMTTEKPTWIPGSNDPVNNGFYREGQNSIISYINNKINQFNNDKQQR